MPNKNQQIKLFFISFFLLFLLKSKSKANKVIDNKKLKKLKWAMNDWMKIVRTPTRYRVGSNRVNIKLNPRLITMIFGISLSVLLVFLLVKSNNKSDSTNIDQSHSNIKYIYDIYNNGQHNFYNSVYPLTEPVRKGALIKYKILAIADLDTSSKFPGGDSKFVSYLLKGHLTVNEDLKQADLEFDYEPSEISTQYSYGDRGMELSELVIFNGKLYSCDDRTGIIYEIKEEKN